MGEKCPRCGQYTFYMCLTKPQGKKCLSEDCKYFEPMTEDEWCKQNPESMWCQEYKYDKYREKKKN